MSAAPVTAAERREEYRQRACVGKRAYSHRAVAAAVVTRSREQGHQVSMYRCPFCHDLHVGHAPTMEWTAELATVLRNSA